jgi:hypothetical protein
MEKIGIKKINRGNILTWWLAWYFLEMPQGVIKISRNFIYFTWNYFSVSALFRTLFSPWRQYLWSYPRGFDFKEYATVFFSNLTSRILGAIARIFLIVLALISEIFLLIAGIIFLLLWFLNGAIAIGLIYWGMKWII